MNEALRPYRQQLDDLIVQLRDLKVAYNVQQKHYKQCLMAKIDAEKVGHEFDDTLDDLFRQQESTMKQLAGIYLHIHWSDPF